MNVEKLKELRGVFAKNIKSLGDVIQLIDILIESSVVAPDRTQPVAEVGGENGAQASVCSDTPVTPALKCPKCGGEADNGHDREYPPNPYYCTQCTRDALLAYGDTPENRVAILDELIREFMHWIRCEGDSVEQLQQIIKKAKAMGY